MVQREKAMVLKDTRLTYETNIVAVATLKARVVRVRELGTTLCASGPRVKIPASLEPKKLLDVCVDEGEPHLERMVLCIAEG